MNKTQCNEVQATRPMPVSYNQACRKFAEWCEWESASAGEILLGVPQPNRGLSKVIGTTWRLRNVNGYLASVGSNGEVWGPRRK